MVLRRILRRRKSSSSSRRSRGVWSFILGLSGDIVLKIVEEVFDFCLGGFFVKK